MTVISSDKEGEGNEIIRLKKEVDKLSQEATRIHVEMEQKQQKQKETEEQTAVFKLFTEAAGQGLGMAHLDGSVIYMNPALLRILDEENLEEVLNKSYPEYYLSEDQQRLQDEIMPKALKEGQWTGEIALVSTNGKVTPTLQNIFLIPDKDGTPLYLANVITDISEQKAFSTALAEYSPSMIFINVKGRVVYANKVCEDLIGYSLEELYDPAFNFMELTAPEYRDLVSQKYKQHQAGIEVEAYEYALIKKDGRKTYTVLNTKLITYHGEQAILGIVTDITGRKMMETEIQRINEELRESNAAKDKFFSIIAHDLRSPFSGLLGLSEVIADPTEELTIQEMRKYSARLHQLLRNQFNLLQNLLEWSRLQRGGIDFNPERLNLRSCISNVADQLAVNCIRKNINLTYEIESNLFVMADADMLQSILLNLITNAIKFTQKNGQIKVGSMAFDHTVEVFVEDSGVGISKERLLSIFKLEEVNSTGGTDGEKGTGLGLILCKEFIERHVGTIHAESELGKGSKFIFTLPKG